jgi:sugar lactone lactonase YvrE
MTHRCHVRRIAAGFRFTEGPVWSPDGFLLFSDVHASRILRWSEDAGVGVFLDDPEMCPNGLALESRSLIVCEHGRRQVTRLRRDGTRETLASHYERKRLNSPNDVVVKRDGSIYFTDPPYGLKLQDGDPAKELPFNGIFRWKDGRLWLLHDGMTRPNGLAFSADERRLYVANSDPADHYWMRFDVSSGGELAGPERFYAARGDEPGLPDGLKLDATDTLYCTGPGGILVLDPAGRLLTKVRIPEIPANLAWGPEGQLFVTARTGVYEVRGAAS